MDSFQPVPERIAPNFVPRYQFGLDLSPFQSGRFIWWRTVSRARFFDELISREMLSIRSDFEAATILYASGVVLRDGRRFFRVKPY